MARAAMSVRTTRRVGIEAIRTPGARPWSELESAEAFNEIPLAAQSAENMVLEQQAMSLNIPDGASNFAVLPRLAANVARQRGRCAASASAPAGVNTASWT